MRRLLILSGLAVLLLVTPALALQANLSWTNPTITPPTPAPTGILVQKAAVIGGPFTTLQTLPPAATTFSDTSVTLGVQVCYQLIWTYALGNSVPLGPACGTPAVGPSGSNLTIIFQP